MPWADSIFENWSDCEWTDSTDCEWDKFSSRDRIGQIRTTRLLSPQAIGDYTRRPYLEKASNPDYFRQMTKYSDKAFADAKMLAKEEEVRHLEFKQPYRYENMQKMKYRDEPAFPYQDDRLIETPMDIPDAEIEYDWKPITHFDDSQWTPTEGQWFDDRWIDGPETWIQRLDDSYWTPWENVTWSGSYWSGSTGVITLDEKSFWTENYRPRMVRITHNGEASKIIFHLYAYWGGILVVDLYYRSKMALSISWGDYDMQRIEIAHRDELSTFQVSNIEFSET